MRFSTSVWGQRWYNFLQFLCEIELSLQSRAHFTHLIFQKCSERDIFLQFLCAHFADLIFQKCFERISVLRFVCEIELSLQFRAHFANPIFQKCSKPDSFFNIFQVQIVLSLQSGARLSTTFADQGPQPQKQRPYFGDRGSHFTRKTQGFAPESLFKPEFTRSRPGALPNYLMMMMWLA